MAKEGFPIILAILLFLVITSIGVLITHGIVLKISVFIGLLLILFSIYFFRDPKRKIPVGDDLITSPADGKIILIENLKETEFFNSSVQKVSIFMSAFDVHVNRIPMSGKISYFNYQKGKYHPAYKEDASYENEHTVMIIENNSIKILVKQIAGIFARRIVCHVREGWKVTRGERFGMIKFGSRLDMILPMEIKLNIKLQQKVKAGETVIGFYNNQ